MKATEKFKNLFQGSDQFYLADPTQVTKKANGGERWGTKKEFYLNLPTAIEGHLNGTLKKGVVLPPIRRSDNKCLWGAIDIDGNIYKDDDFKKDLLDKITELNLPLTACFSKSKGLHLYIRFKEWTDAQLVIDILKTFINKLNLPPDTEIFPKQAQVSDTGNGIMLPYMKDVGNDWISDYFPAGYQTGTLEEFEEYFLSRSINANEIEIDKPKEIKPNGKDYKENEDSGYTKLEILKKLKDGTIEQHPTIGGIYYAWIQVIICKAIKQGYGDNEILKLIKEVHKNKINGVESEYTFPGSYQQQIDYTRGERQLNTPNPGDTKILEGQSFEKAHKYEEIRDQYCYVMANDLYNRIGSTDFYQAIQLNNFHAHEVYIPKGSLTQKLQKDNKFAKAITFVTSAKFKPGLVKIVRPGMVYGVNLGTVLNIYIPNYLTAKKGDVKFIIDFYIWLLGEKKWRMIEKWIAYHLQFPGVKVKFSVVIVSVIEGVGKGLLARICSRTLGSENVNENANYKHLTNNHNTLLIGKQIVVLNEVSLGDFKSKAEGTNTLKNFIGDDSYSCNFKNKPMVVLPNLTNFMLFSNDERVLQVNNGSRRYYFCNIKKTEEEIIKITDDGFFDKAFNFVDSDEGASALIHYFKNEVKIEDPTIFKKRAPITDDLKELIEQSKHPVIKKLEYDLTRSDYTKRKIFKKDWGGIITFDELNDKLNTKPTNNYTDKFDWGSYGDDALYKFLSGNCIKWNNGEDTRQISINGIRHRFYLLDDSRCPIPNKSYKDIAPKDIEIIYKNYSNIISDIKKETPSYNNAKENLPKCEKWLRDSIQELINEADKGSKFVSKKFKGKKLEDVFDLVVNGDLRLNGKSYEDHRNDYLESVRIIKRGIRTPEQIVESYKDEDCRDNFKKPLSAYA